MGATVRWATAGGVIVLTVFWLCGCELNGDSSDLYYGASGWTKTHSWDDDEPITPEDISNSFPWVPVDPAGDDAEEEAGADDGESQGDPCTPPPLPEFTLGTVPEEGPLEDMVLPAFTRLATDLRGALTPGDPLCAPWAPDLGPAGVGELLTGGSGAQTGPVPGRESASPAPPTCR